MKFKTEKANEGQWFPFVEGDNEQGGIYLRLLTPDAIRDIRKKSRKKRHKLLKEEGRPNMPAQPVLVEDIDEELEEELIWDYSITGWKNLQGDDDEDLEPTAKNKARLMANNLNFVNFVRRCQDQLREATKKYTEEEKGN